MAKPQGQIVPYDERIKQITALMAARKTVVQRLLPEHIRPERFMRLVLTAVTNSPTQLAECTPESIVKSMLRAAMLGLSIDDGRGLAYLVPFYNGKERRKEAQLVPGYRGLAMLARQSGNVGAISAYPVREGDEWEYNLGDNYMRHVKSRQPAYDDKGVEVRPVIAAWARATLIGQFGTHIVRDPQLIVLERWEIDRRRNGSQGYQAAIKFHHGNPWIDHYAEMAAKTAVRDLCKLLPLREDTAAALQLDVAHDKGETQEWAEYDAEVHAAPAQGGEQQGQPRLVQLAAAERERREAAEQAQVAALQAELAKATTADEIDVIQSRVDPAEVPTQVLAQIEEAIDAARAALAKVAEADKGKGK